MTVASAKSIHFTKTFLRDLTPEEKRTQEFCWKMEGVPPFDELLFSWNGMRPEKGKWSFWVRLFTGEWSPWIRYAEWGLKLQKTFKHAPMGSKVESYQDTVFPKEGHSEAFQVKVVAEEGADLKEFHTCFVCLSSLSNFAIHSPDEPLQSVLLPNFPRRSQFKLDHPRFRDLCSPTATSNAIDYLSRQGTDPVAFAGKIHDMEFDIYGNWILNTAEAYQELGGKFRVSVERLPSFSILHSYLMRGVPVITSLRGPLEGTYIPMTFGHLLCVIGYSAEEQKVLTIDSGYPEDEQTFASYPLKGFLDAWARRQNIAYLFSPKTLSSALGKMMGAN